MLGLGEALKLTFRPYFPPPHSCYPTCSQYSSRGCCLGLRDIRMYASQYCKDGKVNVGIKCLEMSKSGMWHNDRSVSITARLGHTWALVVFSCFPGSVSHLPLPVPAVLPQLPPNMDSTAAGRHWSLWRAWASISCTPNTLDQGCVDSGRITANLLSKKSFPKQRGGPER